MSRTFKIRRNYYDTGIIFKTANFTLNPGVTILVGCNGFGKSTTLQCIKETLDAENIKYYSYDNEHDGGSRSMSAAGFYGNMNLLATLFMSSEGEKILTNLGEVAANIGKYAMQNKNSKDLWILFDSIDSGFSIDNIKDVKEYLFKTILEHNKDKNVYIICSANSYEMAKDNNCFDVYKHEYVTFKDYEDYSKFILNCKKIKDKRINKKEDN